MKSIIYGLTLALCANIAIAQDFTGTVTHIHDGDTAHVTKSDGTVVKVRFLLVDTPEIDQPHGIAARDLVRNPWRGVK